MKVKIEWKDSTETKLSFGEDVKMERVPDEMQFRRGSELIAFVDLREVRLWSKED